MASCGSLRLRAHLYLADVRLVPESPPESPPVATAVTERRDDAAVPKDFAREPNYPNPFNGDTVIRFTLPEAGDIDVAVYSITGQRVATLVRGLRPAGRYEMRWDGRDDAGQAMASGVYVTRLQAGLRTATTKLLLLR